MLLGTPGAGKTFLILLLALRLRIRAIQCFLVASIKGREFRRACNHIGGEFIKIAPGSPHCINVMEIRHMTSPEMELIDEIGYGETDSLLARKIQQLLTFFGLLIPDMTNELEQMLDEALICSNSNKVPVVIKTSQTELEAILKEKLKTRKEEKARNLPKRSVLVMCFDGVMRISTPFCPRTPG